MLPITRLSEFDRLFNSFFEAPHARSWGDQFPKVNVYTENQVLNIEAIIAGYNKDDIKVYIQDDVLVFEGESSQPKDRKFHINEIKKSKFKRSFILPDFVNIDMMHKTYKDGILHLEFPFKQESQSKIIDIKF